MRAYIHKEIHFAVIHVLAKAEIWDYIHLIVLLLLFEMLFMTATITTSTTVYEFDI